MHRSRSRSPARSSNRDRVRRRSPSPRKSHHYQHHHGPPRPKQTQRSDAAKPAVLPHGCAPLSKHDFERHRALFALYLDVQKQLFIEDLDEREVKGRWKSFVGKWNRAELAEGWYLPSTRQKAAEALLEADEDTARAGGREARGDESRMDGRRGGEERRGGEDDDEDEDEDEFGPAPPEGSSVGRRAGPAVPSMQDIELRNELAAEDTADQRSAARYERKQERKQQEERQDELAPRADPGSRERQLEKKREATATMRSFREVKSPGAEEVGERDLMGEDGIAGYKARKTEAERKKNEREIQREEILRARAAEREERLAKVREKESNTVEMLKALAKQRFG